MLDFYAARSQYFMAAKFDAQRAEDLGQAAGDSTPIMATIPTDNPWVPVSILGLGLDDRRNVEADIFLLTDTKPQLMAGGPGLTVDRSEKASTGLLADLRSDVGMEWMPGEMWLSYLTVDAPAAELDYDLAVSTTAGVKPALVDAGVELFDAVPVRPSDGGVPMWPVAAGVGAGAVVLGLAARARRLNTAAVSTNGSWPAPPQGPSI